MILLPITFLILILILAAHGIATAKLSPRNPYTGRFE